MKKTLILFIMLCMVSLSGFSKPNKKTKTENGSDHYEEVEFPNFHQACLMLEARFSYDKEATIYEERKQANGADTVSLKDASEKTIIQYKIKTT